MKALQAKEMIMQPYPGSSVNNCTREAVGLAIEHKCIVSFLHNGIIYFADRYGKIATAPDNKPLLHNFR